MCGYHPNSVVPSIDTCRFCTFLYEQRLCSGVKATIPRISWKMIKPSRRISFGFLLCFHFALTQGFGPLLQKGFSPNRSQPQHKLTPKELRAFVNLPSDEDSPSDLSYGERSRKYRRDVFVYDNWVDHRSTDRFFGNLVDLLRSGVIRQLFGSLVLTSAVALFVCTYNALLVQGYDDFAGLHHETVLAQVLHVSWAPPALKLPKEFFGLCTPSLALLLVFKTNVSYKRWDEGRKNWGAIVNSSRTIMREGAAWVHETDLTDDQKQRLMERLEKAVWCFPRSLTRHLLSAQEDGDDFARDVREKLRPDLAEDLILARHKPTRALYELSCAINEFPMDERRNISMDRSTTVLCDAMGSNERIFTSPVPRFYTRHTARFLEVWLLLVPLGLWDPFGRSWNHWATIPATFMISFFLLGIEELGIQLEEPFSILPQHAITANSIGKVALESVDWRQTDFQRISDNCNGFQ